MNSVSVSELRSGASVAARDQPRPLRGVVRVAHVLLTQCLAIDRPKAPLVGTRASGRSSRMGSHLWGSPLLFFSINAELYW